MITIAIVDDEKEQLALLRRFLEQYMLESKKQLQVKAYTDGLWSAEEKQYPDIVLMDIEMPGLDGLRAAKEIRKRDSNCVIIFITAMAQYAIRGYEVEAMDYMVKPVRYKDFLFRIEKAVALAERRSAGKLIVTEQYGKRVLRAENLVYVEKMQHKVIFHTISGNVEAWDSIANVAKTLPQGLFAPCNSGYLVNLKFVDGVTGDEVNVNGERLKISRNKKKAFLDALSASVR